MQFKKTLAALAAGTMLFTAGASAAYPERPITIVVPYAPGGAADALARILGNELSDRLNTSIVVENRPGASGTIGVSAVARAAADGYTILYDATPFSINPHLFPKLSYDPKALEPLSLVSLAPNVLIIKTDAPYKTVNDLIDKAKAEPGKLNFASGGSGTVQRLAFEMFRQKLDLDMVHVPYKSGGPAIMDVMSGQVDTMFSTMAASYPLIASGKLRALAISSPQRSTLLPDVPTVDESVIPGYEAFEWNGVFVPAGTPPEAKAKLQAAIADAVKGEVMQKRLAELGAKAVGSTPEEFADYLAKESEKWREVVKAGDIRLD